MRIIKRNPFEFETIFNEEDSKLIKIIAKKRQEIRDKNSFMVTDKRIIDRDNIKTHEIGVLGEYAFQKLTYYEIDSEAYLLPRKKEDFKIHGVTIEVKTLQGYLTFKKISDFKSQVAVLVIYDVNDFSHVFVQGWITRKEFNDNYFIDNFGYGDRPCIQPAALHPISTLKTYCLLLKNQVNLFRRLKELKGVL